MTGSLLNEKYAYYKELLRAELIPAMGCTEPIAIAYAAAVARDTLGDFPTKCEIKISGNIIKNAKSVVGPHTDGMRGIEAALIAGLAADGTTEIGNIGHIQRGYEDICGKLRGVGADIELVEE